MQYLTRAFDARLLWIDAFLNSSTAASSSANAEQAMLEVGPRVTIEPKTTAEEKANVHVDQKRAHNSGKISNSSLIVLRICDALR